MVTGGTDEEHIEHIAKVPQRLSEAGMKLERAKSAYFLPSVEYLGYTIPSVLMVLIHRMTRSAGFSKHLQPRMSLN